MLFQKKSKRILKHCDVIKGAGLGGRALYDCHIFDRKATLYSPPPPYRLKQRCLCHTQTILLTKSLIYDLACHVRERASSSIARVKYKMSCNPVWSSLSLSLSRTSRLWCHYRVSRSAHREARRPAQTAVRLS